MTAGTAVVALTGGGGGAKLAQGLAQVLPAHDLTVVCNSGDDFEHLGLMICPDLDSVTYALAGLSDRERGWGRAAESWNFMDALNRFVDANWFNLGDKDLALHVWRTAQLRQGRSLTDVTREVTRRLGIGARIVPMSDQPVRTVVHTPTEILTFQEYFVRERCRPRITELRYSGAADAYAGEAVFALAAIPPPRAVIICPSNPWLSIDPLRAIAGWKESLAGTAAPVVAISPIVGGRALKGPAAKIMAELGHEASALGIARHYGNTIDAMVIDDIDRAQRPAIEALGIACLVAQTVMHGAADRAALAKSVLALADSMHPTPV